MSQESQVLKELSMLSTNMDLLVKELKEQNKKTGENTEQLKKITGEKDKKPTPADTPQETQSVQNEKFFKNLTQSFAKEILENTKGLTQNLTKQITGDLGGIAKNSFKTKDTKENTTEKPAGQTLESIAKSIFSKIPKFAEGGDVKKEGVALVGEKGPELVQLKKNQKVISNDEGIFQMELEGMKKSKERQAALETRSLNQTSGASEIVTGTPKLAESVKNSFGVEVPKSAIEKKRKSLLDGDPDYYAKYPEDLQEDLDNFIKNYRKEITKEEVAKRIASAEALQDKVQPLSKTDSIEEPSKKGKRKKEGESKNEKEKKESSVISPTKPKLLESLKSKGKDIGSKLKEGISSKVDNFKQGVKQTLSGKVSPDEIQTMGSLSSEMQKLASDMKDSQVKKETSVLNKPEYKKTTSASDQPISQIPSQSIPAKKEIEYKSAEKKPMENSKESKKDETLTSNDIKEIKGLLAGIYKSLSGPLRIANDMPFRPGSNVI